MVYQFHREGFSLPSGATLLATSDHYPNQAFRYGKNAWGIQFHAELTRAMMQRWVVRGAHRFVLPGAQPGRDHLGGRLIWDMHLKQWLVEFLDMVFGGGTDVEVAAGAEARAQKPLGRAKVGRRGIA
jgi:GMP synthase (glutamine-hydrolysing)